MSYLGFSTNPHVLVLRAWDPDEFESAGHHGLMTEAGSGLTDEDIKSMRADGLFPIVVDEETDQGLISGDLPSEVRETLSLVTDPWGGRVLGSRRLTVWVGPDLTDAQVAKICAKAELEFIRRLGRRGTSFSARIPKERDPLEYAEAVKGLLGDSAERVLPEFLHRYRPAWQPDGPLYARQWQWYEPQVGSPDAGSYALKHINIEAAWEKAKGRGVRIAIIDKNFVVDHPDLTNAILDTSGHWPSADSAPFEPGRANVRTAGSSHGTFCAGMAAAHAVEGRGVVGAAPEASLVLLTVDDWTSPENISRAIDYVRGTTIERPVGCLGQVLSLFVPVCTSVDFCEADVVCLTNDPFLNETPGYAVLVKALDNLVDARHGAGIPVFAPAGNWPNVDTSADDVLGHSQVMVVTQVGADGTRGPSCSGSCVDFAAPGLNVYSTVRVSDSDPEGIDVDQGTSYAAPCAAGVAALMLSVRPWLSTEVIRKILSDTCDDVAGLTMMSADQVALAVGAGRINAGKALDRALEEV